MAIHIPQLSTASGLSSSSIRTSFNMTRPSHNTVPSVYGPGSYTDAEFTAVPEDTHRIFRLLASQTPGFTKDETLLSRVRFEGHDFPVIPGPIKAASVAAALHAMSGIVAEEILTIRGAASKDRTITVNTTQAGFWFATIALGFVGGEDIVSLHKSKKLKDILPNFQKGWIDTPLKYSSTALYPTKTPGAWYSIHGSLDAIPLLKSMGINPDQGCKNRDEAWQHIKTFTTKKTREELAFHNLYHGLCGEICFTPEEWNCSEMGKALARHPFVDVQRQEQAIPTPPVAFAPLDPSDKRPLAGVKVVELSRIIAGPQLGAVLTSYGAQVIRINASHLVDVDIMQLTLNAGKNTIELDLRKPDDHAHLMHLIQDADVFVQGFRQSKLEKYGLGLNNLLELAGKRNKGIVYVSENCYGPDGPYAERGGWQQIADAAAGSSYVTGRSLNLPDGECVLPSLPVSDTTTGIVGALGTMMGLRDRALKGGSYYVHASLTAVNTYALTPEVGLYPKHIVQECQERFQWGPMRAWDHVFDLLFTVFDGWKRVFGKELSEEGGWFQSFEKNAFGGRLSILKPVVSFGDGDGSTPKWKTPSVPYCYHAREEVAF